MTSNGSVNASAEGGRLSSVNCALVGITPELRIVHAHGLAAKNALQGRRLATTPIGPAPSMHDNTKPPRFTTQGLGTH